MTAILICLALTGCPDADSNDTHGDDDTNQPTPGDEVCDGVDNDGDGLVDEGYADADGDGVADCIDEDCDVELPAEAEVVPVEECIGTADHEVVDPWNVVVEWQWAAPDDGYGIETLPAVGNLTDDNDDGGIDEGDSPDIAFVTLDGTLTALHGNGTGLIFAVPGFHHWTGVVIADVDLDGWPEVVGITADRLAAVDRMGTLEWTSGPLGHDVEFLAPTAADLEGDGDVEVLFGGTVVEGASGDLVVRMSSNTTRRPQTIVADLDMDGIAEIVLGAGLYAPDGSQLWDVPTYCNLSYSAVADMDGDPEAEVVFANGTQIMIRDSDGSEVMTVELPVPVDTCPFFQGPSPPCVADFDGDGAPEIGAPYDDGLYMIESDGTIVWSVYSNDNCCAACTGFDFDRNGAAEVLYSDMAGSFTIRDGATGALLFEETDYSSGTGYEYPIVADVDLDGSPEIVLVTNLGANTGVLNGITVYGHGGSGWAPSGPVWPNHDFTEPGIGADGTVPSPPAHPWLENNMFRARPVLDTPSRADLLPVVGDLCVASCDHGPAKLAYGVTNQGASDVEEGVPISLYVESGGDMLVVETQLLPAVPAATTLPCGVFELANDLWGESFELRVDDDGTGINVVEECDESNNSVWEWLDICG